MRMIVVMFMTMPRIISVGGWRMRVLGFEETDRPRSDQSRDQRER